jgi:predicted ferric reductase
MSTKSVSQALHDWRVMPTDLLIAVGVGGALVAWWPLILTLQGPRPIALAPLIAHVCGMLAGYGVIVLLGLMSRAPALERGVGADTLARWHARGGRVVMSLIVVHAWAAILGWAQSHQVSVLVAVAQVLHLPYLVSTTVGTALLVAVVVGSVRAARRRMSYERWHALHFLTYLGVALSFLHQLAGPDMAGHRVVQVLWALLYAQVFALVLRHRFITPLRQAARHRLRVAAIVPEAPGVVSIEVEGQHLAELRAESGQFFRWRFLAPDHWLTAHPFSLSAPPTDHRLRLTVKALGDGSARLQDLAVGTWVVVEGPYGAMTEARRGQGSVLLIAGGVGITPLRTLFETLPVGPGQDLTLLYRARQPDQLLFRHELDDISRRRGARLHLLVGDQPNSLSAASIHSLVPDVARRDVYLCGPPAMSKAVRGALRELHLPAERLHEERFTW